MKHFACLVLTLWSSLLMAQSAEQAFELLMADFEKDYSELAIPGLQLSYVDNFENVSSSEALEAQRHCFQTYNNRLKQCSIQELSEPYRISHRTLRYEIDLNLERIALETQWLAGNHTIQGACLHDEALGKEWYAYFLKKWIDASLAPDSAYQFGLGEIETVKQQMAAIQQELKAEQAAMKAQQGHSNYHISNKETVLEAYRALQAKVRPLAQRYFPNVDSIAPAHIEESTNKRMAIAPGYYSRNTFYFNFFGEVYDSRDMGWLFLHEATPGHHYQNNLATPGRPPTQQLFYYMGYAEGWGAYVEQYGTKLGAYTAASDVQAHLEWDLIRAVRVPLDVGLNYYGWSDEQALDFWQQHIANKNDIALREIQRMKRWPAQVLTYNYGKHLLNELKGTRNTPEALKVFHQQVLKYGDMPLSVLRSYMRELEP